MKNGTPLVTGLLTASALLAAPVTAMGSNYQASQAFKLDGAGGQYPVVADFNADGMDDLALAFPLMDPLRGTASTKVNFLVGNAAGAMKIESSVILPVPVHSMAAGDFDGDGVADLAIVPRKAAAAADPYCGAADGVAVFHGLYNEVQPDMQFLACMVPAVPGDLAVLDANGDGLADLIIGDALYLGDGNANFRKSADLPAGPRKFADVNADGLPDIVTSAGTSCAVGHSGTFIPCGGPDLLTPLVAADPVTGRTLSDAMGRYRGYQGPAAVSPPSRLAVGDLDGDGIDDLVGWAVTALAVPEWDQWVYRPASAATGGRTGVRITRPFRKARGGARQGIRAYGSGYVYSYSAPATIVSLTPQTGLYWTAQHVVQDNKRKVAASALRIALLNADGSVRQLLGAEVPGKVFNKIELLDVDGDGRLDVLAELLEVAHDGAVSPAGAGDWMLFSGNGDGSFAAPVAVAGLSAKFDVVGDWNGDGLSDLGHHLLRADSEDLFEVAFHVARAAPAAAVNPPLPQAAPQPAPAAPLAVAAPQPATPSAAVPTQVVEGQGLVSLVGQGFFEVNGTRFTIDAGSTVNYQDGYGPAIQVGDPVQFKAQAYSDGTVVLIQAEVG